MADLSDETSSPELADPPQRHPSGQRPALADPPQRHPSGQRPALADPPQRHPSGQRPALADPEEFALGDGRVPWATGHLVSGRYEIERPLGGGSMGDVFLAEDRLLKKPVALKVLRPDLAQNRDTVRRFLREVALAHSVTHQNVVRIYDTGEDHGLPFFTMEVLQGEVLEDLLEGEGDPRQLSMKKIRSIAFDILDGIEAAHLAGVVHRDLKPANVMLTHRGAIVMDFGVAGIDDMLERNLERNKAIPSTKTLHSLVRTEAGTIFGSPAYMAPELWEGQPASVQSDLYAFGVMLYQMLTGRLPYSAKTPAAFVEKLATAPPPPLRSMRRDVPWNLVRLVRRCMAREVQERPLSASAAANLISPLRNRERRRFVGGASAVAAIAVGALWMRSTPSWRDLGLPDALAEAELSAAVRAFDVGERTAALRQLRRLSIRAPDSAALAFWRATVHADLGDPDRPSWCLDHATFRGSATWQELAAAACESPYRLAEPIRQTLTSGPRSVGPELLPLAVHGLLIPRLDLAPQEPQAQAEADAALASMDADQDLRAMWALPVRTALARRNLASAMARPGAERGPRLAQSGGGQQAPLLLEARSRQHLLEGEFASAAALAEKLRAVDPSMGLRIQMHEGRLAQAWAGIDALGDDPRRPWLVTTWCGYALRFEMPARPVQCTDLAPGLTRALWDVTQDLPADVSGLDNASVALVERFGLIRAGRCGGGTSRAPRVRQAPAPFELFAAQLELAAALCTASPAVRDLVRAQTLATDLARLSVGDPWLLMARAAHNEAKGSDAQAHANRITAAEQWQHADPGLPLVAGLRARLGTHAPRLPPPQASIAGPGR